MAGDATADEAADEAAAHAAAAASNDTTDGNKDGDDDGDKGEGKFNVDEILDEYGLESPDELKDFITHMQALKGKIGDQDLDKLIENSKTLETYQAHWAKEEQRRLKEKETPEETIKRLEKEKEDLQQSKKQDSDRQKAAKSAERAVRDFNETVTSTIKGESAVPSEYRPFLSEFLGVDNPINDVDIEDKAAVRRLSKEGIKKMQAFEQAVIKRYRDGKIKIPAVSKTETTVSTTTGPKDQQGPKTLKDAKRIMMESVTALLSKK
jgi:hypothetical protein